MKKILLFCAALFAFSFLLSCDDDEVVKSNIVGVWKPVKMVETTADSTGSNSESYYYTDCQQLSRWTFNEDKTGSVLEQDDTFTACHIAFQSNINYQYNPKTGEIVINYLTGQDTGKISDVTDTTMNLKIEEIDLNADTYESQVYTMVRVN